MMSAKMTTPDLLKKTVFWSKDYDLSISVDDVTNKVLSRDSNYFEGVLMWPKFGNPIISVREGTKTSILYGFDRKKRFFDEKFWFKFNNLGLAVGTNLKFYTNVTLKLKLRKFLGLIPTFIEVTVEKQVPPEDRGTEPFGPAPFLIWLTTQFTR